MKKKKIYNYKPLSDYKSLDFSIWSMNREYHMDFFCDFYKINEDSPLIRKIQSGFLYDFCEFIYANNLLGKDLETIIRPLFKLEKGFDIISQDTKANSMYLTKEDLTCTL
jgi:hypothetical protein